jgi:Tfp pilus assembly PilM family ATPase
LQEELPVSILASWLASPAPDAAVEIGAESVSVAVLGSRGADAVIQRHALEPLPPGAVVPALTGHNITAPAAVSQALRAAYERIGMRPKRVALIVPDLVARVSMIKFDQVPARSEDLHQLIQWQLKKSAPFPVEEGVLSYAQGARTASGSEFVVELARRDIIREYETVVEELGGHAGLVELASVAVVNLFLAEPQLPVGDWLVVHMRPAYTSIALMRGEDMLFFRSRAEGDEDRLEDLVHQTAMYYEDRLSGRGFARVLLGGTGRSVGAVEAARRSLEERLGSPVEPIDPTAAVQPTDRISVSPESSAALAPLLGILLRTRREAVGA